MHARRIPLPHRPFATAFDRIAQQRFRLIAISRQNAPARQL